MSDSGFGDFQSESSSLAASVLRISLGSSNSRTDMDENQRRDCIRLLLHKAEGSKIPRGTQVELAQQYGVSRWTIGRIWKAVQKHLTHNQALKPSKDYKGKVGRKVMQIPDQAIMDLPLRKRCNIRSMACALNISKSSVHRLVKWGKVRRHSSTLKPALTVKNKIQRLRFCLQQLDPLTVNTQPAFKDMFNVIHVDEKWFFMSKTSQNFYLAPTEMEPYRATKHKSHICKVMFLVAVTRPWYGEDGELIFDGKIGCFPLVEILPAQRTSRLRPRGTLETKPIKHVTQAVIKRVFLTELLPAIKAKWPISADQTIYIQQDNATPHLNVGDAEFQREATADGFNIILMAQPPNSPDLNVLDLGFFRAIQSIQHQQMPRDIDQLVSAVKYSFHIFEPKLLNFVFLTYMYVMREIFKVGGGNNYIMPHAAKHRMEREGTLPIVVDVPTQLVLGAITSLLQQFRASQDEHVRGEEQYQDDARVDTQYLSNTEIQHMEVGDLQTLLGNLSLN